MSAWRNAFVGAVVSPIDSDRSTLHGACFAFLDGDHFVTADHLIEKAIAEGHHQIQVMGPGLYPVTADVFRHSSADVAVLRAGGGSGVARFEEVADPELTDRVELLAYRDHGLKVVKTTVTGFGWVDLAPRYAFAGFELADAPGPGFSGSPVLDERGRVLGISTQTRRDGDTERGMAMQLGQVMPLAQRNHKPERGHGMSANSGEEISNRCIVEGTGRDGQPLQVERYAGQQPGAVAFSEVVPSPSFSNPSFDTNTTGWSGVTRDTVTSTPGRPLAVSRLTGLGLRRSREPSSAV